MAGFSGELYNHCRDVLLRCSEFSSDAALRTVFVTAELRPFRDGLPEATNKRERVDKYLDFLLSKRLSDGRPVLPLFLTALRDRYRPGDDLRDELEELIEAAQSTIETPPIPTTKQTGWIAWSLVSFGLTLAIVYFFAQLFRCLLEYRLTEAIVGLLVALVGGAATALSSLAPPNIRNPLRGTFGGITLALLVCVLIAVSLPKLTETECFPIPAPAATPGPTPVPTFVSVPVSPTPTSTSSVAILSPSEGEEVSIRTRVYGQVHNVPGDHQLWALVQSSANDGYYPQPGPIEVDTEGDWESMIYVGRNLESQWHKPFTITVVLANAGVSRQFSDFLDAWPADRGLTFPEGDIVRNSVCVIRNNPIVTLDSHLPESKVQGYETMAGTYVNLEAGDWYLYGVVKVGEGRFIPYGPFEPVDSSGEWTIAVEFPWPADGEREISFHTLAVLSGTSADETLQSAAGSSLSAQDLSDEDWANIYGPVAKTSLIRAERIAFASDKPGNDDIFIINADGSGLIRLTDDPADDSDPAWSPDSTCIVFASKREGPIQLFIVDAEGQNARRLITASVIPGRAPTWSSDGEWIAFHSEQDGNVDIYKVRAGGTDLTQLTDDPADDFDPAWSPDGKQILFFSERAEDDGDRSELYVMDADGSGMNRLTHNEVSEGYATWSPDGQHILFTSDIEGSRDVYLMDADGSNAMWLADVDYDRHPTFAPDGQRFVFDSSVDRRQLFLATLEGGEPTQIQTGLAKSFSPAWSPVRGDERIAFVGRFDGDWEIYTIWGDGTDLLRLMDSDSNEVQPRISPDGQQVAFASDIDGDYEIWLENARTPAPWVRLTDNTARDWQPAWSPDGRKLAFASDRDGDWDIYVMNANGTGVVQLTDDPAEDSFPAWSSDGKRIVFYSGRSGDGDIYVMDAADGGNVTPLVANPGFDWSPAWSPDGRTLVFASARDHSGTYATELYALDLLSGDLSRLTDYDGHYAIPLWSGDGRRIYFTSDRYWGIDDIWVMDADGSNPRNLTGDDRSDIFGGP